MNQEEDLHNILQEKTEIIFKYLNARESKKRYMIAKWLVSSISGAFITFFISFIGLIISLYCIPDVIPFGSEYAIENYAGNYFVNQPFL